MSSKTPARSILKQSTPTSKSTEDKAKAEEKNQRNLNLALRHAHRIETQKKIEALILRNIETLLELPSTNQPASKVADAHTFTTLIHPFQPSDFAALVEERRINHSCGYALCSNAPRAETLGASAVWKLKGKGAADFCSTACVRKAVYVKAQLCETPAWERVEGQQGAVVLPEEDRISDGGAGAGVVSEGEGMLRKGRQLAAERGEESTSFKPRQVMLDSVLEKPRSSKPQTAPSFPQKATSASGCGAIEGYEPRFSTKRTAGDDRSDDDAEDEDDEGEDATAAAFQSQGTAFESEIIMPGDDGDDGFGEEEEAAWREMQAVLRQLDTGHDR